MSQNICRRQFTCRSLGFRCSEDEKESFYVSQWGESRVVFFCYRLLIWIYSLGWSLAYLIDLGVNYPDRMAISYVYLTNWGDVTNTIYFTLAAALSLVGVVNRKKIIFTESIPTKILRSATWIFYSCATSAQSLIAITYWALLAPIAAPESIPTAFNIHRHAINAILILLDVWVAGFPIRLLHFIYATAFATVYILMTVIEFATGGVYQIYPFLNWKDSPGTAAGIAIAFAIGGPIIFQSIWFGFYNLKRLFTKICCSQSAENTRLNSGARFGRDIDNPAFDSIE